MSAYDLPQFCSDLCAVLEDEGPAALDKIAERLERLLANRAFVEATFDETMPPGKRELFRDPRSDARVLAHVQPAKKAGAPHSHGASWAVYGNARGYTEMTEWRRLNPETDDHAELAVARTYRLGEGESRSYPSGVIHSTAQPEKAWVIRVTGTDLDLLPRFHFKPGRDRMAGAEANAQRA